MGTYLFEVTFLYRPLYSNVLYLVVCRNLTQSRHETLEDWRCRKRQRDDVNYTSSTLFPRFESLFCGSNRNFDGVVLYFSMSILINKQFSIFDAEF